jgi:prepilin-type N-terminal cleavage/methylation domain-containing protein
MIRNKSKGFTIIELLVVIAIIAVLAAIVLVNVTAYINKGRNASIKGNLSTLLVNSATFYDLNSSYTDFCIDPNTVSIGEAIGDAGGSEPIRCIENTDATEFCACSALNTTTSEPAGTTFCVDSAGNKKQTSNACATACPSGVNSLCV